MTIRDEIDERLRAILGDTITIEAAMSTPLAQLVEAVRDAHTEITWHAAALSAALSDIETGGDSRGLAAAAAALESAQATYRAAWAALGPAAACLVAGIEHANRTNR